MKLLIDDKEFVLDPKHVALARDAVNALVIQSKNAAIKSNNQALYWTVILMMYKKASFLLDGIGLDNLANILSLHNPEE